MILMWLGPLVLMFVGVAVFREGWSRGLVFLQEHFLKMKPPVSILRMLTVTKLCAFAQGSLLQNQYGSVALLSARVSSRRYALLLLCLSAVGAWPMLICFGLAWQVSGFYFLAALAVVYLGRFWTGRGESLLRIFTGLGLFLLGVEWTLRQQGVLFSILGESDFHFLLADGRFFAQLIWLAVSALVTLVLGFEFWSVLLSLVLVTAGSLSLNGAIALMTGELLAHVGLLVWRTRGLSPDAKKLVRGYALSSIVGLVVGFFVAGYLRDLFAWSFTFDVSQLLEKNLQLGLLFASLIVSKTIVCMVWGHFAVKVEADQVQTGGYFSSCWVERGWISVTLLRFLRKKLGLRLTELQSQAGSLQSAQRDGARAAIPPHLLQAHAHEIEQLKSLLQRTDKSREIF